MVECRDRGEWFLIFLFTDFGRQSPYQGEVIAVLKRQAPAIAVIDLLATAPPMNPRLSAYLLRAYRESLGLGDVMLAVVDPGVGTERQPLAIQTGGSWLVGPDNGLFELILRQDREAVVHRIDWRSGKLSTSFHGRDLFAPVAARLARGQGWGLSPTVPTRFDWPDDLAEIVFIDDYGNAMTGLRAAHVDRAASLRVADHMLCFAPTFAAAAAPFWYENSVGLVEIAVNGNSAAAELGLVLGSEVRLEG